MPWKTVVGCALVAFAARELPGVLSDAVNSYGVTPLAADLVAILGGAWLVHSGLRRAVD
jgi:hypothetical protein